MTVYVDDSNIPARVRNGSVTHDSTWCHLFADSQDELHTFAQKLGLIRSYFQAGSGAVLVSGACPEGADEIAERVWTEWGGQVERHRVDWRQHRKRAGFIRNGEMVRAGADAGVAFVAPCSDSRCTRAEPHGSHGATNCADQAEAAGITVDRHERRPAAPEVQAEHLH